MTLYTVSWHVTPYAVTCYCDITSVYCCNIPWYDALYVVELWHLTLCLLWHNMSLWHSHCLLLRHSNSGDVTYVFRPFENIMFQSFIILSFLELFWVFIKCIILSYSWVIVELYSVKQNTESVQFVDVIAPQCHVTLPNMKLNIWIFWHWTFGINITTQGLKVCLFVWWCLTPLSTIFQLFCGSQFYWWRKPEDPRKPKLQQLVASHRQTLSHNVVHLSLINIRINKISSDRQL